MPLKLLVYQALSYMPAAMEKLDQVSGSCCMLHTRSHVRMLPAPHDDCIGRGHAMLDTTWAHDVGTSHECMV